MTCANTNSAFVLGGSVNSLGVVKALGRKGVPTVVIHESDRTISRFSRYAKFYKSPHPVDEVEPYLEYLIDIQKKFNEKSVLLPTSDVTVIAISKYHDILEKYFNFNLPSSKIIEKITSKEGFYQLAREFKLLVPRSFSVECTEALENCVNDIEFPCIIKPYYSHSWRTPAFRKKFGRMQIFKAKDKEELINSYQIFADYDPKMIVQEFIRGDDDCEYSLHTYTSRDGQQMINFLAHKLRLDPIHHGSGAFVETAHKREIFKAGNDFLKNLNYRGMSSFQFKWDPYRKEFFAIELNPRYSLWNFLEPSCGVNYPYINYRDSLGFTFEIPEEYKDGVKWFSLDRDINAFFAYRREGSLSFWNWIYSYKGKTFCAEFSWDDPLPFLYWLWQFCKNSVSGIGRKIKKIFA